MAPLRIVYFGTPAYAVPALRALSEDPRYHVELVVTQPDRPSGRGRSLRGSAVKEAAEQLGLSVYQPVSLRQPDARALIAEIEADLFMVAAYGLIFGAKTLALPRWGCLNLHASLLPRYRGASPVTAAILSGDIETGVSLMRMEIGLDTGPVLETRSTAVLPSDTTETLTVRLAELGAELARDAITRHIPEGWGGQEQDSRQATVVRPLVKADGWVPWQDSAVALERRVRAMWNWPRAWTTVNRELIQIHAVGLADDVVEGSAGQVQRMGDRILVSCGERALRLDVVQPEGKKAMPALAWYAGRRGAESLVLGLEGAPTAPPPLIQVVEPSST
jgi:methionyl-tRNA formyltransferase